MYLPKQSVPKKQQEQQYPSLTQLIEIISESNQHFPIASDGKSVLDIKFDKAGNPVRKVVRRSSYRQTYQLFSKKMKATMSCESLIEFNACYIMESIPEIKSYQMQPAVITYLMEGEIHYHIPDALIKFNGQKKCFLEFKDMRDLDDEKLLLRTDLLGKNLPTHGYGYLVIFDDQVSGVSLTNAKKLIHMQSANIPQEVMMEISDMFSCRKKITICEILKAFSTVPHMKNYLYQLILKGMVGYDLTLELTKETELYWKGIVK